MEEDARPLEDADQVRSPLGVVLVDQGGQLGRPGPDPGGREQDSGEMAGVLNRVQVRARIDEGDVIRDVDRNEPDGSVLSDGGRKLDTNWSLEAGEVATVVDVDRDGDFRLQNASGSMSNWVFSKHYVYA